ncbi:MAG: NYN domain-containing protein [Myxococcota bacterium]
MGEKPSREELPNASLPDASEWLIDGFNLLHAAVLRGRERQEWWTEPRRRELLRRIRGFGDPSAEIWVVFDGARDPGVTPGSEGDPRIQTVFAPSADDWLVKRVRGSDDPGRLAVVTADRQVQGRARHGGALVVAPRLFLAHCSQSLDGLNRLDTKPAPPL